jgi:hypothetical protein
MTRTILAVIMAAFLCQNAQADNCVTPEVFVGLAQEQGGSLYADIREPAHFLRAFNAVPPPSNIVADRVMVFRHPGSPIDWIGFFSGGCLNNSGHLASFAVDRAIGPNT